MKWCLKCQAENPSDATVCRACGEPMPAPATGWRYVIYMFMLLALCIGSYLFLRYLKAEGHITGWLADRV